MKYLLLLLAAALLFAVLSCGSGPPPVPTAVPESYPIAAAKLAAIYRTNPNDRTYRYQLIRVELPPKSYWMVPAGIETHRVNGNTGAVRFETVYVPPDNSRSVLIIGRVMGIVRDGVRREDGVDYYVRVADCSVVFPAP